MLSSRQPPRLHAHITGDGVLTVQGLPAGDLVVDHDELDNAHNELLNLAVDHALECGGEVWLLADSPTGLWGMAVRPDATVVPIPVEVFDPVPTRSTPTEATTAVGDQTEARRPTDDAVLRELESALAAAGEMSPPPAEVVLALAADPAVGVRAAATAELSTWSDDDSVVVTADLTADQLDVLADNRLPWVRAGVAGHPATGEDTLDRLAGDTDPSVVRALAARLDLPARTAARLARHPHDLVRAQLGQNPAAAFLVASATAAPDSGTGPATAGPAVAVLTPPDRGAGGDPPSADEVEASEATPVDVATRPQRRVLLSTRPRMLLAGGLAAGVLLVGGTAWALHGPASAPTSAAVPASVAWHGTWLPTGHDGPADPGAPAVAGFAHTEVGAALAAAHLSVRIDPYAGPASFTRTITTQTYGGDPNALLARTRAAYDEAATAAGISDGSPIPTSTGQIVGWRIPAWATDGPVLVHLLVTGPDGRQLDYGIAVTWVDGDYRLVDPTAATTFTVTTAAHPNDFTPFSRKPS